MSSIRIKIKTSWRLRKNSRPNSMRRMRITLSLCMCLRKWSMWKIHRQRWMNTLGGIGKINDYRRGLLRPTLLSRTGSRFSRRSMKKITDRLWTYVKVRNMETSSLTSLTSINSYCFLTKSMKKCCLMSLTPKKSDLLCISTTGSSRTAAVKNCKKCSRNIATK